MATRTIVTCDLCKKEIKPGERVIYFSATRWSTLSLFADAPDPCIVEAKFDTSEFCSDGCVLTAVRGLLNGAT